MAQVTSRTHILHLIESDGVYGAEHVVLALADQASRDPRLDVTIACLVKSQVAPNPLHEEATRRGIPAIKVLVGKATAPIDLIRLVGRLRRLRPDVVHAHGYKAATAAWLTRTATRIPILATCHLWYSEPHNNWTYRWLTRLELQLYRSFPTVVAVSRPIRDHLIEQGVAEDAVRVIQNGIRLPPADTDQPRRVQALAEKLRPHASTFILLNVGRLAEQKAQASLVEAVRRLRSSHPHLSALILGEGPLRDALNRQIAAAGLGNHVHLVGFDDRVADYLVLADAFVLPSLDEGLPIALLEALGAGLPVVATRVGAIPDVITDGVNGLLVAVGDADGLSRSIARLLEDPGLGQRLGEQGRQTVLQGFTAEAMHRQYLEVYSELTPIG